MSEYHNKRAKEILFNIKYATIATCSVDGQPWNSPVWQDFDENLHIYWVSDKDNQHSKNIRENPNIFIVIYDSTAPHGTGEGVYIKARAQELNDQEEIHYARQLKKGQAYKIDPNDFLGNATRRIYKAVPEVIWMNDAEEKAGVFLRDYRVEIPISTLKEDLKR